MERENLINEDNTISKRERKRALRRIRIRNRLFKEEDIKYQGPLSYRALRIIAWLAFAVGQIAILNSLSISTMNWNPLGTGLQDAFSFISSIDTPLFIIASFGLVLNKKRGFRNFLLLYGAAFLSIGLGVCFFYYRYINGVLVQLGLDKASFAPVIYNFIRDRVHFNVFADLFSFALFNYFVNYQPKKLFPGKSIYVFRLFSIFPVLFILASYVLKILSGVNAIELPFYIYPFMATKSPIIFAVFVIASLWIKNRERLFVKLGASKEQYQSFLLTNRNSLSFSTALVFIIILAVVLDMFYGVVLSLIYFLIEGYNISQIIDVIFSAYSVGQSVPLLFTIPIIFLYSYTRIHKNNSLDITIPIAGIGLTVLIYIEAGYQFITQFISG